MRTRTTKDTLLHAIADRLVDRISSLGAWGCLVCDQSEPPRWPTGVACVVVSAGAGEFPEAFTTGGGAATLCEQLTVDITPWIQCSLDAPPDRDVALFGDNGLLSYWHPAILRALLITESDAGNPIAWDPVDQFGNQILRSQLAIMQCAAPGADASQQWLGAPITVSMEYDWQL